MLEAAFSTQFLNRVYNSSVTFQNFDLKRFLLSVFVWSAIGLNGVIAASNEIWVCSFNIQFLGFTKERDNIGLAQLLKDEGCDIVVVEELVAPPSEQYLGRSALNNFPIFPRDAYDLLNLKSKKYLAAPQNLRVFPPGPEFGTTQEALDAMLFNPGIVRFDPIIPEPKATEFFDAMASVGFIDFILSDEDTGPQKHHSNTTASEWWLAFFNSKKLEIAKDLPYGFLDRYRAGSDKFDRVPFAFPFRSKNKRLDFVLIPVHLAAEAKKVLDRQKELRAIDEWIADHSKQEHDFIVLGDTNIQKKAELARILSRADAKNKWRSLNEDCDPTNTMPQRKKGKPYEQVFYNPDFTTEAELPESLTASQKSKNFIVISLIDKMKSRWQTLHPGEDYPGGRENAAGAWIDYDHDKFRMNYSDHNPIKFLLKVPKNDDD